MRVAIVIDVDDLKLAEHVRDFCDRFEADHGGDIPRPEPHEWLRGRIQAVVDDELRVALWDWADKLGMTAGVSMDTEPLLLLVYSEGEPV